MSGIKNIKKISKSYKEAEIFFHQDLDGVCSCLSMKHYLERNNIKVINTNIIQYGSLEYNINKVKQGVLPVLVDFAHAKDMFIIYTDHHNEQVGANNNMSTNFKKARSNAETISGEISSSDVFTPDDIELIRTIDSADFYKYNITPQDVQNCIFNINKNITSKRNRFLLGMVVNRILLAFKNKRIKVKSLNGNHMHNNKNLLECLVCDSEPSVYSMYINLLHYIKNGISYEWHKDLKTYFDPVKMPTLDVVTLNNHNYANSRKEYIVGKNNNITINTEIEYDKHYKIVKQHDIGDAYKVGSYDRYVIFNNFPHTDFVCTVFRMGLIQVSVNPFKPKINMKLGNITKELYSKYSSVLSLFRISLASIKKINENESYKLSQKSSDFFPVGFRYDDLMSFYKDDIYYLPNRKEGDMKTIAKLDMSMDNEHTQFIKNTINKLYKDWTFNEKEEMEWYKISGMRILESLSGGHNSITNLQGFNFLDERKDAIKKYFGNIFITSFGLNKYIENSKDLMIYFANEFINMLKLNIELHN